MSHKKAQNQKDDDLPLQVARRLTECEGYLDLGMLRRARETLEEVLPDYRKKIPALLLECRMAFESKNWLEAKHIAEKLLKADDADAHHWALLAAAERRVGAIKKAINLLEEASLKFPDCAVIFYNLACYYCIKSQLNKAFMLLQKAFKLDSNMLKIAMNDPDLQAIRNKINLLEGRTLL
jgi:tetratricopeptide (TPR) repeat protein